MDTNQIIIVGFSVILTAIMGSCGYFIKTSMDQLAEQVRNIHADLHRINSRLDAMSADIADMKPKVDVMWRHFLQNKNMP